MNYNLLEEKWIPVLWQYGHSDRVGVIEALSQAGRIRQIAASNPMDRLAILRFLLVLLYWCKESPPDGEDSISSFPSDWFKKLKDHRDCFNLLGDGKRFYQCNAKSGKERKLSANYLMQEVPTGTNVWHFRHSTDKRDGLCPACCAAGLLRLPLFATSGGRGKPPGLNQKPPVYVMPVGVSLAETLRLSWRKVSDSDLGMPTWEKPDLSLPKHGNVPLLIGLTWLPRRVWLDNPVEPQANCISCGRKQPLIRQCVFAGIGSTKTDDDGQGRVWSDPHTISDGEDVVKPSDALGATDAAAGQWTKIAAGILGGKKANGKRNLWIVGFATVKNDKYLEAMEYEVPLSSTLDDRQVAESVETIERWRKEGWKLARKAKPRGTSRKHLEIPPTIAAVRPHVETTVSEKLGELISQGGDAWEQAAREYSPMMAAVAKSLSPGFTTAALRRRREIANVRPNMRPDTAAAGRAGRKKGGNK
ncbi:MAG TPA: type I-E CRISPR-associated protein Cse1/CasA [Terriglobia bacterium]|nr:type I-E CRISPR-associated protein Cse1/CasA [Terriglobia bacterium]HUZ46209.1 type I-E CRISPR-associated protein Cse1/CasA [Terriglobia bacterium]